MVLQLPTQNQAEAWAGEKLKPIRRTHNATFIGTTVFVKAFDHLGRYQTEIALHDFLKANGLPYLPIIRHELGIIAYVLAEDVEKFDTEIAAEIMHMLHHHFPRDLVTQNWSDIHQLRVNQLTDLHPTLAKRLSEYGKIIQERSSFVPIHADMNNENMVRYKGQNIVIDWEWLSLGPVEWDFASVLLHERRSKSMVKTDDLIKHYRKHGGSVDMHLLELNYRARELHSVAWSYGIGKSGNTVYERMANARAKTLLENSDETWHWPDLMS